MANGGYYTNGMSDFTPPFTGLERIPVDTNNAGGNVPEQAALSPALIGTMGLGATVAGTYTATTTTLDLSAGSLQTLTLAGNITLVLSDPSPGQKVTLVLTQDATGSRLVTWPAEVEWPSGTAPTLTTTAARSDVIELQYDGTLGKYYGRTYGLAYNLA